MGKIFYIMGKSSSGKDTIYRKLQESENLKLGRLVLYTTRPIRDGEKEGQEYHFVDEAKYFEFNKAEKVIDGTDKLATAGFVNAHTHVSMTLLRSYADDMKLMDWLENKIWPIEAKMKKEDNSSSMLQLFFFYFTFAPAKEPKDLNLIIDIGNTKAKIAFFDGGEIVDVVAESNQSLGCLKALCSQYPVK